jgi:putative acetyltransferase
VEIVVDDLRGAEIASFLEEHLTEMRRVTPPESVHALDLDRLRVPEVVFWTMRDGGEIVATAALKLLGGGDGEIKSMRVAPAYRRRGLASAILAHVIAEARVRGLRRLWLETGSFAFFDPARRLYERHGFEYCEPFGDYEPDANSSFMMLAL